MPGGHLSFQPKRQSETCYTSQPFDFIASLQVGETINSCTTTATVYSGTDLVPGNILSGSPAIVNSTQVIQLITGGVVGVIYEISCKIITSLGQSVVLAGFMAIIPDLT
jgi:hypothetical protein